MSWRPAESRVTALCRTFRRRKLGSPLSRSAARDDFRDLRTARRLGLPRRQRTTAGRHRSLSLRDPGLGETRRPAVPPRRPGGRRRRGLTGKFRLRSKRRRLDLVRRAPRDPLERPDQKIGIFQPGQNGAAAQGRGWRHPARLLRLARVGPAGRGRTALVLVEISKLAGAAGQTRGDADARGQGFDTASARLPRTEKRRRQRSVPRQGRRGLDRRLPRRQADPGATLEPASRRDSPRGDRGPGRVRSRVVARSRRETTVRARERPGEPGMASRRRHLDKVRRRRAGAFLRLFAGLEHARRLRLHRGHRRRRPCRPPPRAPRRHGDPAMGQESRPYPSSARRRAARQGRALRPLLASTRSRVVRRRGPRPTSARKDPRHARRKLGRRPLPRRRRRRMVCPARQQGSRLRLPGARLQTARGLERPRAPLERSRAVHADVR